MRSKSSGPGELPETITKSDLALVFGGIGRQTRYIEFRIRSNAAIKAGLTRFGFSSPYPRDTHWTGVLAFLFASSPGLSALFVQVPFSFDTRLFLSLAIPTGLEF